MGSENSFSTVAYITTYQYTELLYSVETNVVSQAVEAVILAREGVQVMNSDGIQLPVAASELKRAVFLGGR